MQLGIVTPVFTRVPGTHSSWEAEAGIEEAARIAMKADELGYHHVTCSEHIGIPTEVAKVRGFTYWDPLSTFGYFSAVTSELRFVTFVLVLGYHHPMELVKRYGTLDRVSGGRLILGVGVGSLKEEFDLIGADFEDRGARGDDAIRALKASFGKEMPEYHGEYYDYEGFVVEPRSIQTDLPIWVGGRTYRSLRRAVELGDGWVPFGLPVKEMAAMIERARATDEWAARTTPIEIALQSSILDPIGDPDGTRGRLEHMQEIGTTVVETRVKNDSLDECLDQLTALRELWPL
jgi:probable F420-dependent oxidoreductase